MNTPPSVAFGTHLPALIRAVQLTDGPILECGTGMFSTPFLHFACYEKKRKLVSYDDGRDDYEWAKPFANEYHTVALVDDWEKTDMLGYWGVVLIDHNPKERRKEEIRRLANSADYIVVHDTQPRSDRVYRYSKVFPLFKYRKDFQSEKPYATVLSNFHDLTNF